MLGPGRVGQALARRWRESGCRLLGFHGRTPASCAAAVRFAGGRVLRNVRALAAADVVLIAVPDRAVAPAAAAAVAAGAVGQGALWLHASGRLGLEVLLPVVTARGRIGSLHPLIPFPSPRVGYALVPGSAAGVAASRGSLRQLQGLARRIDLRPIRIDRVDRARYHAACALVANGITALCATAMRWLDDVPDARHLIQSLMLGVHKAVEAVGADAALTGPAARGDLATLLAHQRALRGRPGSDRALYAAAMQAAAVLAHSGGGLSARALRDVRALLRGWLRG